MKKIGKCFPIRYVDSVWFPFGLQFYIEKNIFQSILIRSNGNSCIFNSNKVSTFIHVNRI